MAGKMYSEGEIEKVGKFLDSQEKGSRKGMMLYHSDADGVCSAALFLKFFRGFEYIPRKGPAMREDIVETIVEKKPGMLVFLDMAAEQEREKLELLLRELPELRIIIIDHHIAECNMNSERVVHLNPRFREKGVYMPAACMVYRLLEGMGKYVKPLVWMAALGVIGDYGWDGCPELIKECRKGYPFLLEGKDMLKTRLAVGADMVASAVTVKGFSGIGECLKVLLAAQGFEDFESSKRLQEWHREFESELGEIIEDFGKNHEHFREEGLRVYKIESRLNLTSILSTNMGTKFPEDTLLIRKQDGERWKVSMRNQSGRVNLGEVVKEAVKGIGSGGGHEKAAAALVSDWELFLKRLRKALSL